LSDNRARITAVILATVAVAQLNWYNLPAIFPLLGVQLGLDVSQLALIGSAFIVGVGLFQVPAGILAAKIGLKRTVFSGAVVASVCSLLVGTSSELYSIAALRLLAGMGVALVYAPGMMLIVRHVRESAQSLSIGLYSAIGDIGGIVGLSGWAVLSATTGWRLSLALSGALGLISAALLFVTLPGDYRNPDFQIRTSDLRKVLLNRNILIVSSVLLGMECGWNVMGYFMVYYLESHLNIDIGLAGLIGSFILIGAVLGAPIIARTYDLLRSIRLALLLLGVACAFSAVLVSTGQVYGAIGGTIIEGVLNGAGFAFVYILARKMIPLPEYEALSVAWVNEIATFGSFWSTVLFSYLVIQFGYPLAWSASSLVGIFFILPVLGLGRLPSNADRR
jgi:MFS family permease